MENSRIQELMALRPLKVEIGGEADKYTTLHPKAKIRVNDLKNFRVKEDDNKFPQIRKDVLAQEAHLLSDRAELARLQETLKELSKS